MSDASETTSDVLGELARIIHARRAETSEKSYTRSLLEGGPVRCAKKFGEEAVETVIAAVHQDDTALKAEAADVLYHLLVLLECRNISLTEVLEVLGARLGVSGHVEKASRKS